MTPWKPTHCLKGEFPYPVMLIEEKDGTVRYHDGFAKAQMASTLFHKLYCLVADWGKRPRRSKKAAVAKALKDNGPLPTAVDLAARAKKTKPESKPGWKPKDSTGFFV